MADQQVADDTHCGFLGCDGGARLPSLGLEELGLGFEPVGLRQLAEEHFKPRWTALDIVDFPGDLGWFVLIFKDKKMRSKVKEVLRKSSTLPSMNLPETVRNSSLFWQTQPDPLLEGTNKSFQTVTQFSRRPRFVKQTLEVLGSESWKSNPTGFLK